MAVKQSRIETMERLAYATLAAAKARLPAGGDFGHWSIADIEAEQARYREYLARGLAENEARGFKFMPVDAYANKLDSLEHARQTLLNQTRRTA